jgi:hypothetical protein
MLQDALEAMRNIRYILQHASKFRSAYLKSLKMHKIAIGRKGKRGRVRSGGAKKQAKDETQAATRSRQNANFPGFFAYILNMHHF